MITRKSVSLLGLIYFFALFFISSCRKAPGVPDPGGEAVDDTIDLSIDPAMKFFHNGRFRGINVGPGNDNARLDYIVNETGANILRVYFTANEQDPSKNYRLMDKVATNGSTTDPDAEYPFKEENFGRLIRILDWARARGDVKIIIDPHTAPGFKSDFTTSHTDKFWLDKRWRKHLIRLWEKIIDTVGHRGSEIAGYELFNEPMIPDPSLCPLGDQWNDIVDTLVKVIRSRGAQHPILVQPAGMRKGATCDGSSTGTEQISIWHGVSYLNLPADNNIVVAPHFYLPQHFTHQGIKKSDGSSYATGIRYPGDIPGTIAGGYWDKNRMSAELDALRLFMASHPGVPVFMGEFSVARAAGPDGDVFLNDLLGMAEDEGWSWAYHAWEGLPFNPATEYAQPLSNENTPTGWQPKKAPRLALLRQYTYRNFAGFPPADQMIKGLYRMRHPSHGDELLTASLSEVSSALFTYGYTIDGVFTRIATAVNAAVVPVYALRNPATNDRLYTTSHEEVTGALSSGYEGGGIKFYAATAVSGAINIPVYRLKKAALHRYCFSTSERDAAVAAGWTLELEGNPAFYCRPNKVY